MLIFKDISTILMLVDYSLHGRRWMVTKSTWPPLDKLITWMATITRVVETFRLYYDTRYIVSFVASLRFALDLVETHDRILHWEIFICFTKLWRKN